MQRSTIIGEATCRILEFMGHDVERINHTGDWGTQFGMLLTHMRDTYPDFIERPPSISDLNTFYKASKVRFDAEPDSFFAMLQRKEKSSSRKWPTLLTTRGASTSRRTRG